MDRTAGGVEDGARLPRCVRRPEDQQLLGLAELLRALPHRPGRLAAPVLAAHARPAGDARLLGVALVLQRAERLREHVFRLIRPSCI